MRPNAAPAGSPTVSMPAHNFICGVQERGRKWRYAAPRKYMLSHDVPTPTAMNVAIAAPDTPRGVPMGHPKINIGARMMLTMTVAVWTTMPGLKFPVPRSAEDIETIGNCNAIAGMNHAR